MTLSGLALAELKQNIRKARGAMIMDEEHLTEEDVLNISSFFDIEELIDYLDLSIEDIIDAFPEEVLEILPQLKELMADPDLYEDDSDEEEGDCDEY